MATIYKIKQPPSYSIIKYQSTYPLSESMEPQLYQLCSNIDVCTALFGYLLPESKFLTSVANCVTY